MQIIRGRAELSKYVVAQKAAGRTVALVPTMGALHDGHTTLMRAARKQSDVVIVYIFVNPKQFGPNEDFERYPRPFEQDAEICKAEGVDMLYAPVTEDVYPAGYDTVVSVRGVSEGLDGDKRPGHFDGVATVLTKMFNRVMPDKVFMGEKDYQQLLVVKQLVRDLDMPVEVIGVPTEREADGLAKSSRNLYLSKEERATAPKLYAVMQEAAQKKKSLEEGRQALVAAGFRVDYLEVRDGRLFAAVFLGKTRLIDNVSI